MSAVWTRLAALLLACGIAFPSAAVEPPLASVAFEPRLGTALPMDAGFFDEHGRAVRLGEVLRARPAILVPAYYGCSNLCGVVLNGLASALRSAGLEPARDVEVVAIGIAPLETPADAMQKKRAVLGDGDAKGWHFLTGREDALADVAKALGYRYAYVAQEQQYAHASGIAIASPSGRVTRAMFGVDFPAADLRAAIATASDEPRAQDASPTAPAPTWLLCFHYDPHTGRYTLAAVNAVRAVGLLTLVGLAAAFVRSRRAERSTLGRSAR